MKIKLLDINYIDSVERRLAYHLINKEVEYSNTMKTNFANEVQHLTDNHTFMVIAGQNLLVNMLNIKSVDKRDCAIHFENGDSVRIPKARLNDIYNLWKKKLYLINFIGEYLFTRLFNWSNPYK